MVYFSKQRSFTGYATVSEGAGPERKGFAMDVNCEFLFLILKKKKVSNHYAVSSLRTWTV